MRMSSRLFWYTTFAILLLAGTRTPVAFGGDTCPDSTVTLASLYAWDIPADGWDVAATATGYVYVTDPVNNRVCRYSIYGSDELCWDSPGPFGEPGLFEVPQWLQWNPINNRIYVSGQGGPPTVPVFDASGVFLFDIMGDSLSTEPGDFAGPTSAIAIDPVTGSVWIHEDNDLGGVYVDRIQEFDISGNYTGLTFDLSSGCKLQAPFAQVVDLAVDSTGSVYILEGGYHTGVVHRYVPGVGCVANWGDTPGAGALYNPTNVAIDNDGLINVLDFRPNGAFVYKYNRSGAYVAKIQISTSGSDYSLALDFLPAASDPFMFVTHFDPHRVEVFGRPLEAMNMLGTSWIDDNSFQLKTENLSELAECSTGLADHRIPLNGVAADGVSPLLLRLHVPEAGSVRWKLRGPDMPSVSDGLGGLATLDSTHTGIMVDSAVELVDGEYISFAVYKAPVDFERVSVSGDLDLGERPLEVTATFMPASVADSINVVHDLTIVRPTVFFLHGFMETPDDWKYFQGIKNAADAPRWHDKFVVGDYASTSGEGLESNAARLATALETATTSARDNRKIAAAQVDIISHSMGGLVLRRLADSSSDSLAFRSKFNMGKGYYHKALFLNVPHEGAPIANICVTMRKVMETAFLRTKRSTARWVLETYARMANADFNQLVYGGAIDDMSLNSAPLSALQPFVAPTHSHVGTGGSDLGTSFVMLKTAAEQRVLAFMAMITSLTNIPELALYAGNQHDIAVLLDSQKGGLVNPFHFTTAHFEDGLHEASFSSDLAGNLAQNWATTTVADGDFFAPMLPGGSAVAPAPEVLRWARGLLDDAETGVPEFAGETVRIVTPGAGFTRSSGDSFLVEVQPMRDVSTVIVSFPGGALVMDSTLAGYVHTDSAFVGAFELSVLALMADGTVGRSDVVAGTVRPPVFVPITNLTVEPQTVYLAGVGRLVDLQALARYSDGVVRDISQGVLGTTYEVLDPTIASASPNGVLRGAEPGMTTVTVRNGASSYAVSVEVGTASPMNNRPHAVAGGPYQVCNGDGVTLDASGSFDFDGDALTYAWDLDGDGQFGDLVGQTAFYSPPYIVDERLVGLRVTDSNGATSTDYATIQVPLSCFLGERVCVSSPVASNVTDLGTDGSGNVYEMDVSGSFGTISKRSSACAYVATGFGIGGTAVLDELAVDSTQTAYVIGPSANEEILVYGPGMLGQLEPKGAVSTSPFSLVSGIAVDRKRNLFGSDYDSGTLDVLIRKFDQTMPEATLLASWNLTADAGVTSAESLVVAVGPDSSVFVGANNEILKGVGQGGAYLLERRWGETGLGAGQFRGVADVAVGVDGDVFVVDYENHRIQRFGGDGTFRSMRKGTDSGGVFYHPTAVAPLDSTRVAVVDVDSSGDPRMQVFYWGSATPASVLPPKKEYQNSLSQNYPNPFNPATTVRFSLAQGSRIVLAVYDVRGALVRTLVDEEKPAGVHSVVWNGENDAGVRVSSGVYFCRLVLGGSHITRKMVLLK